MASTIEVVLHTQGHVVTEVMLDSEIDLIRVCVLESLACRESERKHRQRNRCAAQTPRQELLVSPPAALPGSRIEPLLVRQIVQCCRQAAIEVDQPAEATCKRVRRVERDELVY